ncbi:MAG: hypothetical protein AAB966_02680 [Patescibacteria group bacterium]
MKTDQLMELIDEHLQEVNSDTTERLKRIDEMLFFLNFNRRLTKLSDEEKQDFANCHEGFPWTENMRATYDNAPDKKTKDYYIDMWARSTYFRRCAWESYLSGYTNDKPTIQKSEAKAA